MFELFLEIHLAQLLGLGLGYLLINSLFDGGPFGLFARMGLNLILGCAAWALLGVLILLLGISSKIVFSLAFAAGGFLLFKASRRTAAGAGWLRRFLLFYSHFVLLPFCFFLFFACMLLAQFKPQELGPKLDQWETARRVGVYHVPDHVLQWQVSQNLFSGAPLETGFRRHKVQIWSAGDRPILIGLLDASYSKLSGLRGETIYFLRIIFLAAYCVLLILGWLIIELKVERGWAWLLAAASMVTSPFLLTNVIYTWPKFAGLAFVFCSLHSIRAVLEQAELRRKPLCLAAAGLGFALGVLCHAAAIYGVLAGLLYLALTRWSRLRELGCGALFRRASPAMLVFLAVVSLHSAFLAKHTRQTGLLARVQFCRGGSFAHPTKVISLYEACSRYYFEQGVRGILRDRAQSFHSAFVWGYEYVWTHARELAQGRMTLQYLRREWDKWAQMLPLFSYGFCSAAIVLVLFGFSGFRLSTPILSALSGFLLLAVFSAGLAQFEEMRSHVVPFAIPVFIWLGVLAGLYSWHPLSLAVYSSLSMLWQIAVLAERKNWMVAWQNPLMLWIGCAAFFISLLLIGRGMAQRYGGLASSSRPVCIL